MLLAGLARNAPGSSQADTIPKHDAFTIAAQDLAERRTVNVYTPSEYATSHRAFPVLYMLDGGLAEDFPHIVTTVDSLIRLKRIRPFIVVGIENTERRRDLTGPTVVRSDSAIAPRVGGSAAFRRFIRAELMPEVRRRYRCTDETGIVGESLAGLFVLETLLLDPMLFRSYIAFDPSVWWNGGELMRTAEARLAALSGSAHRLYFASSKEPSTAEGTARLAEILKAHAPAGLAWEYQPGPDLEHGTIFRALAPAALVKVLK
jgi:predicted alpha/beta superfamily hydrolase